MPGAEDRRDLRDAERRGISKSLNISFDCPATAWQRTQPASPKKRSAPRFSDPVIAARVPAREPVDRRVGESQRELELRDRLAEHREVDRAALRDLREELAESAR